MPQYDAQRKDLTDLVASNSHFGDANFVDAHVATVTVGGTTTVEPIGIPVVWNDTNSRFEVYTAASQITAAATAGTSPLAGGTINTAILAGTKGGLGHNSASIDLNTDTLATVIYRGEYAVKESGMDWNGISTANQDAFRADVGTNRIYFVSDAAGTTPTYTNV